MAYKITQNLSGKTAVVTGTGGIGYAAALALARAGAFVIVAGRNPAHGTEAIQKIRNAAPDAAVHFEQLDLADNASIDAFADRFEKKSPSLDILLCIAGIMMPEKLSRTKEGVEMQFASNYLGHFKLTLRLLPLLNAAEGPCGDGARVVTISSVSNLPLRFDLADATAARGFSTSISYALSKLACLMFAIELNKRCAGNGFRTHAFSAHPGFARTQLFSYSHNPAMLFFRWTFFLLPFFGQKPAHAAEPALLCATSPEAVPGKYYGPLFYIMGPPRRAFIPFRARDKDKLEALWNESERLAKISWTKQAALASASINPK